MTHPRRPVENHVRVWRHNLRSHRQRVCNLEERGGAEGLCELGAQAREARVVQEDIALDLAGNVLDGAGVVEAQCLSPVPEGIVCVEDVCEGARVGGARPGENVSNSLFLRRVDLQRGSHGELCEDVRLEAAWGWTGTGTGGPGWGTGVRVMRRSRWAVMIS